METDPVIMMREVGETLFIRLAYFMSAWGALLTLCVALAMKPYLERNNQYRDWFPWLSVLVLVVLPFFFGLISLVTTGTWFMLVQAPAIALNLLMYATLLAVLGGGLLTTYHARRDRYLR